MALCKLLVVIAEDYTSTGQQTRDEFESAIRSMGISQPGAPSAWLQHGDHTWCFGGTIEPQCSQELYGRYGMLRPKPEKLPAILIRTETIAEARFNQSGKQMADWVKQLTEQYLW